MGNIGESSFRGAFFGLISRGLAAEAAIPVIVDRDVEAANESFRLHPKSAQWVSDPERFTALWRDFPP